MKFSGRKILLGITGGIAAYKCCELVRLFVKSGADLQVVMSPSAVKFVSPVTLSVLSNKEVKINMFPETDLSKTETVRNDTSHIYNGINSDLFLIAPLTANTAAKITYGLCDNLLTASVLAARCPVMLCPSMDEDMLFNEATQSNLSKLKQRGFIVIEPESGELASGLSGFGRMPEPESIFKFVSEFLSDHREDFTGKKLLITAGPTYEPIDDVRFIGNYSSGKMGFSLARAASQRGADVTLVTGPSSLETPRNVKRINVKTADEMFETVFLNLKDRYAVIMASAVADFKATEIVKGKIKKSDEIPEIRLTKTKDILFELGKIKNGIKIVGFALESENEMQNAEKKLVEKNLDLIVLNKVNEEGAGFGTDTNIITIIGKNKEVQKYSIMSKFDAANKILDKLAQL